jgi:trigger factor
VSRPYDLHFSGDVCEFVIGNNTSTYRFGANVEDLHIAVMIDNRPIIGFAADEQHLLLSANLFDEDNQLVLSVRENELQYSVKSWDVELVGRRLTIRSGVRDIFVELEFDPPNRVVISRGKVLWNGIELRVTRDGVLCVNDGSTLSRIGAIQVPVALGVGQLPPIPIGFAIHMREECRFPVGAKRMSQVAARQSSIAKSGRGRKGAT